jgi:hypothetical protein
MLLKINLGGLCHEHLCHKPPNQINQRTVTNDWLSNLIVGALIIVEKDLNWLLF